eukprot:TRINITY_DN27013_c0_g1_i1.p2 TRINITY_DN27013_c0_g1~~TRINITY_DN27013_c0_g1_i1.p2  ORF type:complete len:219 (-),score=1.53 TRINITY_DN27013_c0_g1_i1:351-1007(-)
MLTRGQFLTLNQLYSFTVVLVVVFSQQPNNETQQTYDSINDYVDLGFLILDYEPEMSIQPPIAETYSLKQQCQECIIEEGGVFTQNGCWDTCPNPNEVVVVREQFDSTVVIRRVEPMCIQLESDCLELEDLTNCKDCLAFNGVWVLNTGCQQECPFVDSMSVDTCWQSECPGSSSTDTQICTGVGGILCESSDRNFSQCVSTCAECLCDECSHFLGSC